MGALCHRGFARVVDRLRCFELLQPRPLAPTRRRRGRRGARISSRDADPRVHRRRHGTGGGAAQSGTAIRRHQADAHDASHDRKGKEPSDAADPVPHRAPAGRRVHVAPARQESRLHRGGGPDARARHRRHDRDLQRGLRRRAAAAAAARSRAAHGRLRNVPGFAVGGVGRQLHRCRGRRVRLRGNVGEAVFELQPRRRHDARAHHRRARHGELLRRDGRPAAAGAGVHRRGRPAGQRTRGRPEPSAVDAPIRRQPRDGRQHDPHERRELHRRGRDAAVVRSHHRQRRTVDADRLHAGPEGPA